MDGNKQEVPIETVHGCSTRIVAAAEPKLGD